MGKLLILEIHITFIPLHTLTYIFSLLLSICNRDVLFVAHRMKLKGSPGPTFTFGDKKYTMSISKTGFNAWKDGHPIRNACAFATSFMYERAMLMINDVVVAITGRNYFFPNKPKEFHDECAKYCRYAVLVRALLWKLAGWKALLFLYLSETLWSIPPHPACAMFVTNHGSNIDESGNCIPSSSTYAGRWYSLLTCKLLIVRSLFRLLKRIYAHNIFHSFVRLS